MALIAKTTIQEVNDRLDAFVVINDYVRLEQRGGRYVGLCPFHHEKTPSFTVNPDLKLYHCFGCGKGGTVLDFVMEMDKLTFPETIELLAKRFDVPVVYDGGAQLDNSGFEKHISEITELYGRVAGSFHYFLMERKEGAAVLRYITSRNISRDMLEKFRVGYAPADRYWLFPFLEKRGYSETFLATSGLFSSKYPRMSFFSNRLMFPIADRQGRTVAFGGRILANADGPKYVNSSESAFYKKGQTLFAIDLAMGEIRRTREVYIAEGYMDVIALHQAGVTNAVAPLGTAFTEEQAKLLKRWAERVRLVFDADDAGQRAAEKAILTCRRNGLVCAIVEPVSAVKDPADILKDAGPDALREAMTHFIPDIEYLLRRFRPRFDMTTSEGKSGAVAALFPYLETLDSAVARDAAVARIAEAFSADRAAVLADFAHKPPPFKRDSHQVTPTKAPPIHMNDELYLLIAVAVNQHLYPQFRSELSIDEIETAMAKELFITLEECCLRDEFGMTDLLDRIESDALRAFVIEKAVSKEFAIDPERFIVRGVGKFKRRRLEKRRAELLVEIHIENNLAEPSPRFNDLIAEKMHIDEELYGLKTSAGADS